MKPIIRYMVRFPDGTLGSTAYETLDSPRATFGLRFDVVQVEIRVVEKKPKKKAKVKHG